MPSKVNGGLRHRFWGDYSASIVLVFETASARDAALATLPGEWIPGNHPRTLVSQGDGDWVRRVKDWVADHGGDPEKVDSLRHSVDYGEPFEAYICLPEELASYTPQARQLPEPVISADLSEAIGACAKGRYQRALLSGMQRWAGAGSRYRSSRRALLDRVRAVAARHGRSARIDDGSRLIIVDASGRKAEVGS